MPKLSSEDDAEDSSEDDAEDHEWPAPLTPSEAQRLRQKIPSVSPWWVVSVQFLFGAAGVMLTWWWGRDDRLIGSFACGVGVVWLPALILVVAHAVKTKSPSANVVRFFVWQLVKWVVSVALIGLAAWKFENLNWPLFMGAMFLTLKVYWLALLFKPKPRVMVHV